jgi:DNA (cytosine-5)-methyltransferase 1
MSQSTLPTTSTNPRRQHLLRLGSLCTGYGGLDMAVQAVFGAQLAWCADNDSYVSHILAMRHPGAPNLGDLTELDWRQVDPVDILAAGFPCQDISYAGRGAGIKHQAGDA